MISAITRGDVARLAAQEAAFRARMAHLACSTPEQAQRLAQFAHQCVAETPLDGGRKPLTLLDSHPEIQHAIGLVGRWLSGEPMTNGQLQEASTAARRQADTLARDMVGTTAAQWAAIAAIEAAQCALAPDKAAYSRAIQAVGFAALYSRAAGMRPSSKALHFQITLADRLLVG